MGHIMAAAGGGQQADMAAGGKQRLSHARAAAAACDDAGTMTRDAAASCLGPLSEMMAQPCFARCLPHTSASHFAAPDAQARAAAAPRHS